MKSFLTRLIFPIALGVATISSILAVGYESYQATSRNVLDLTYALLRSTQHMISGEVNDYVVPVTRGNRIATEMMNSAPRTQADHIFDSYTSTLLTSFEQIQSFYLADDNGHLRMVDRSSKGQGILDYTTIVNTPQGAVFRTISREKNGQIVAVNEVPATNYDVRTREWYQVARTKGATQWSTPYLTSEEGEYVITASQRFDFDDGRQAVFATNISLNNLSHFLAGITLGHRGRTMIVDDEGHIVANRDLRYYAAQSGWNAQKMVLANRNEPLFTLAFDHYRVHGIGMHTMTYQGKKYVNMSVPLRKLSEGNPPHWILLIVIPQDDFGVFLEQNSKQIIQFITIVASFFIFLSIILFRQIRRTGRMRRDLEKQQDAITKETGGLHQVAVSPRLFDTSKEPFVMTEQMTHIMGAQRCSIWRFVRDGKNLICEDIYDASLNTHSGGMELQQAGYASLFDTIGEGLPFTIEHAQTDPRTRHFAQLILKEGADSELTIYPIHGFHGVLGVFMLEGTHISAHLLYFVELMNDIASIRFTAQEMEDKKAIASRAPQKETPSLPAGYAGPNFDNLLAAAHAIRAKTGITPYPKVAVLVISFADPVVSTVAESTHLLDVINHLASYVQTIARRAHLDAVVVAGHRMICMSGCTIKEDAHALDRLATAALQMREAFADLLTQEGIESVFTMGMDYGPAFGGLLGGDPKIFNLWGSTVSSAELIAKNDEEMGSIQVTERVYMTLRGDYLFRSRGMFYVPFRGLEQTYTLTAGR